MPSRTDTPSPANSDEEQAIHERCATLSARGDPIPLDLEEQSLRLQLARYPDRADLIHRLCAVLAAQNKRVPLDLEEQSLQAHLAGNPERNDLKARLVVVQRALGKLPPPAPFVAPDGTEAAQTDVDFQREADEANRKSGLDDTEPEFRPVLAGARRFTMTSDERIYALYQAVRYLEQAGVHGAIVECGVWRGGSMMAAMLTLLQLGRSDREFYLYDTYEGLPRPDDDVDVDIWGHRAIDGWLPHARGDEQSNWAYASLNDVRTNVLSTGYPAERVHFIKGMVEKTMPGPDVPDAIALLRLDTDWYASTRHELVHLYPRLVPGGVLIVDDYGHFKGARKAVDEYIREHNLPLLMNRIDYSGRMAIKIHATSGERRGG